MGQFKGTKNFYAYEASDNLVWGLKAWIDYSLLETGAFTNVRFSNPDTSGYTSLKRVHDDRYNDGQIWDSLGPSWIWENDIIPIGQTAPYIPSGLHVNNQFIMPNHSTSGYKMNFREGQIIFNSPFSAATNVQLEYSFPNIATYLVDSQQWKTILQQYTEKFETEQQLSPSGMASTLKEKRVWLPSIIIEVQNRTNAGFELGGSDLNQFTVGFHIFSDSAFSNRRLLDILGNQYQKTLVLFDLEKIPFPYNYDGTLNPSGVTYPNLAQRHNSYYWTDSYIKATDGGPRVSSSDIFRGELTMDIDIERHIGTY